MKRLGLAVLALALVITGVAWLGASERVAERASEPLPAAAELAESSPPTTASEQEDLVREEDPARRSPAESAARASEREGGASSPPNDAHGLRIECEFQRPDGSSIVVEEALLSLDGPQAYRASCAQVDRWVFEGVARGTYTLSVETRGYRSADRVLVLDHDDNEDVVLWPAGWIAVILRTPEGLPFEELARELALDPESLFVGAFEVVSTLEPPDDATWATATASGPALFRGPPGYKSWNLPGSCIGSLMPSREPPFWAGLKVFGVPHGWELVPAGAEQVAFTLDADALAARLGTLALRVVDAESRSPLPEVSVTLLADTSAYRRRDHHDVKPTPEGNVAFERIVPDRYELSITRGEAFHQERLTLAAGERRDLGEIALGAGSAVVLRVIDEEGRPVDAWIEVGPYRPGARPDDLYPSMVSRSTDEDGEHRLACPSGPTIVRAKTVIWNGRYTYSGDPSSADTLLDPAHLAPGPLVIVVHDRVEQAFDVQGIESGTCEVIDELGLVVEARAFGPGAPLEPVDLLPARYRVCLRADSGDVVAEKQLDVGTTPGRLTLP